jgi:hypothetical protein
MPLLVGTLLFGGLSFHAQGTRFSPDQINQVVAPIALYPDALMSQVLMAATFPDQVTDANQWVRANPDLTGNALDGALATATWDPSVIALCKFPSVLDRMAQNITWTNDLGNAFLTQRTDVMNAVQTLRSEAYRNGHLQTTEQQRVVVQGPDIVIQPATPEVIYVPTYQPAVVYGSFWNYPSYYYPNVWAPWPGYSFVNGFAWGIGFGIGNILFGGCDWGHHDVWMDYGVINNCSIYRNTPYYHGGHGGGGHGRQPWVHNADYAHLTRGGAGAPYGGRDNGRVRGIHAEPAALARRGTDRAAGPAYLGPAQRNTTNRSDRGVNRPGANGSTGTMARGGDRPAAHGPAGYSGRRTEPAAVRGTRPSVNGSTARPARGVNRVAAHGPTGYRDNEINRPAMNGSTGRPERGVNRPAVHGPTGYAGQGVNRPSANGSTRSRGQGVDRRSTNRSTGYAERGYNRPASRPQAGYSRPNVGQSYSRPQAGYSRPGAGQSYSRPAARPQTSSARPSAGQSYSRPAARGSVGHNAGGSGRAAAPRGGQRAQGHR